MPADARAEVAAAVARALPSARSVLEDLVRIPSVSATSPGEVARSAEAVAAAFAALPGVAVDVLEAGGAPAVLARRPAPPGAPTVLLYAHHDVQPAGDPSGWSSPPFEPTVREGRLFGRGAADDKAGVAAHLAALAAHLELHRDGSGAGVSVLVEGEEEIGSPTLGPFLERHGDLLRCDAVVVADSANAAVGLPALTTTLRGLVGLDVTVSTLDHPLHSGMYGGAAPDPLAALVVALATLWDADGAVAVDGLPGPSPEALAAGARQRPWDEAVYREEAGVVDGRLVGRGSVAERVWLGPSATVIGIDAPRVDESSNTLYPRARARVTLRVPPGADAERAADALEAHLRRAVPWRARVEVERHQSSPGFAVDTAVPAYEAARRALRDAWGVEPVDLGVGGSIPFVPDLAARLPGAAVLVTGVEDPDSRAHGTDESLHLGDWEKACLFEALFLEALGA